MIILHLKNYGSVLINFSLYYIILIKKNDKYKIFKIITISNIDLIKITLFIKLIAERIVDSFDLLKIDVNQILEFGINDIIVSKYIYKKYTKS